MHREGWREVATKTGTRRQKDPVFTARSRRGEGIRAFGNAIAAGGRLQLLRFCRSRLSFCRDIDTIAETALRRGRKRQKSNSPPFVQEFAMRLRVRVGVGRIANRASFYLQLRDSDLHGNYRNRESRLLSIDKFVIC